MISKSKPFENNGYQQQLQDGIVQSVAHEFEQIAYHIRNGGFINPDVEPWLSNRRFLEKFGCSSTVCANAWLLIVDGQHNMTLLATKDKLLWSLNLLKIYNTEGNLPGDGSGGCD